MERYYIATLHAISTIGHQTVRKLVEFFGSAEKPVVLISGGSRGARAINTAMIDILLNPPGNAQFLHVTGKGEFDSVTQKLKDGGFNFDNPNIKIVPYLYNMPQAMATADLAIFRAGATGLAELTARGVPAILIPFPFAAENHQEFNAQALVKVGAARMILNKDLNSKILSENLNELLQNPAELKKMAAASLSLGKPQAAANIADLILEIAK